MIKNSTYTLTSNLPIESKKILLVIILTTFTLLLNAQSTRNKKSMIRLVAETGVFFPEHENFRSTFETNSTINWRTGFDFGGKKSNIFVWARYSTYQLSKTKTINISVPKDTSLLATFTANSWALKFGLGFPVRLNNGDEVLFRLGMSYNNHYYNNVNLPGDGIGGSMAIGYNKRITKASHFLFNISYDYNKIENQILPDWSGFGMTMGLAFNLVELRK